MNKVLLLILLGTFTLLFNSNNSQAQTAMNNVSGRHLISLNGKWNVLPDPTGSGNYREVWKERKPQKKTDFVEYAFEGGPVVNVPGDFNTQLPDAAFMEGTVWYKKTFNYTPKTKRLFLHFGAVNYLADVYLNGERIGQHEGGFTPFQFEISGKVKEGINTLIVKVNNQRRSDGIPGTGYDWLNYGGITRDVNLIETDPTYIDDYFIQLKKHSLTEVMGWVKLNGNQPSQIIHVRIPELGIDYATQSNAEGMAEVKFNGKFNLWSPANPKLYKVIVESQTDTLTDEIGFRSIETKGTQILLNGKPIFLKGVNIHEENPYKGARATSEADASLLLNWAKELGCNMVRLAHYPHNENMIRQAEKMGIIVWSEIPVYQHIEFATKGVPEKMDLMMREMVRRDRNRCAVAFWSISNETYGTTPNRDNALTDLAQKTRQQDSTRLVATVICTQGYSNNTFDVWDPLYKQFDVVSVNEYLGWYVPWQGKPKEVKWKLVCPDKPLLITEFGGEALYGSNFGPADEADSWREEYQEKIFKDQIEMFSTTPNLAGVCPWLLVDYRSPQRMHPSKQGGWNRKGLLSENGDKKKAWYVLKSYYEGIKNNY
ncbi:MAG TPA: glycoside hydrolase family 2 TIM barrel-domain containing protein [Prolixibacteraceae bacterium]|nr:glycoside hydrolase family 2 TIM barrel-domain containing protein [Prolixibacteraceae bacterium]